MLPGWNQIRQSRPRPPHQSPQQHHGNNQQWNSFGYNNSQQQQQQHSGQMMGFEYGQGFGQVPQHGMGDINQMGSNNHQQPPIFPHQMMGNFEMQNQMMVQDFPQANHHHFPEPPLPVPAPPLPVPVPPPPPEEQKPSPPPLPSNKEWWKEEMSKCSDENKKELESLVQDSRFLSMDKTQQVECWQQRLRDNKPEDKKGRLHDAEAATKATIAKPPTVNEKPAIFNQTNTPIIYEWSPDKGKPHESLAYCQQQIQKLKEQEKKFEGQYSEWHKQFEEWKDKHKDHPNKNQFVQYEQQWVNWQNQMKKQKDQNHINMEVINKNMKKIQDFLGQENSSHIPQGHNPGQFRPSFQQRNSFGNNPQPRQPNFGGNNPRPNNFEANNQSQNKFGANNQRQNNFGVNNVRPNNFGATNTGHNNFGTNNMRPNNFGENKPRQNNFGANNMRPKNFGANNLRQNNFDANNMRPKHFGANKPRQNNFGANNVRPNNFGTNKPRPNNFGANNIRGPRFSGARPRLKNKNQWQEPKAAGGNLSGSNAVELGSSHRTGPRFNRNPSMQRPRLPNPARPPFSADQQSDYDTDLQFQEDYAGGNDFDDDNYDELYLQQLKEEESNMPALFSEPAVDQSLEVEPQPKFEEGFNKDFAHPRPHDKVPSDDKSSQSLPHNTHRNQYSDSISQSDKNQNKYPNKELDLPPNIKTSAPESKAISREAYTSTKYHGEKINLTSNLKPNAMESTSISRETYTHTKSSSKEINLPSYLNPSAAKSTPMSRESRISTKEEVNESPSIKSMKKSVEKLFGLSAAKNDVPVKPEKEESKGQLASVLESAKKIVATNPLFSGENLKRLKEQLKAVQDKTPDTATPSTSATVGGSNVLNKAKDLSSVDLKNILSAVKTVKDKGSTSSDVSESTLASTAQSESALLQNKSLLGDGLLAQLGSGVNDPLLSAIGASALSELSAALREDLLLQEYLKFDPLLEQELLIQILQDKELEARQLKTSFLDLQKPDITQLLTDQLLAQEQQLQGLFQGNAMGPPLVNLGYDNIMRGPRPELMHGPGFGPFRGPRPGPFRPEFGFMGPMPGFRPHGPPGPGFRPDFLRSPISQPGFMHGPRPGILPFASPDVRNKGPDLMHQMNIRPGGFPTDKIQLDDSVFLNTSAQGREANLPAKNSGDTLPNDLHNKPPIDSRDKSSDRLPIVSNERPPSDCRDRTPSDSRAPMVSSDRPPNNSHDRLPNDSRDRPPNDYRDRPPFDSRDRPPSDFRDRPPSDFRDRLPSDSHDRPPFDSCDRPPFDSRDRPPFDSRDRPPFDSRDRPPFDSRDRPPFDSRDRPPFDSRDRPPFDFRDGPSIDFRGRPPFDSRDKPPFDFRDGPPIDFCDRPPMVSHDKPPFDLRDRPPYDSRDRPPSSSSDRPQYPPNESRDRPREFSDRPPLDSRERPLYHSHDRPPMDFRYKPSYDSHDRPPSYDSRDRYMNPRDVMMNARDRSPSDDRRRMEYDSRTMPTQCDPHDRVPQDNSYYSDDRRARDSMERVRRDMEDVKRHRKTLDGDRREDEIEEDRLRRERSLERLRSHEMELQKQETALLERERQLREALPEFDDSTKRRSPDRKSRSPYDRRSSSSSRNRHPQLSPPPPRHQPEQRDRYHRMSPSPRRRDRNKKENPEKRGRDYADDRRREERRERRDRFSPHEGVGSKSPRGSKRSRSRSPRYDQNVVVRRIVMKHDRMQSQLLQPQHIPSSSSPYQTPPMPALNINPMLLDKLSSLLPIKQEVRNATVNDILNMPGRLKRPKKIVIILRGLPGSGKTHIAKTIRDKETEFHVSPRLLGLDDYFMTEVDKVVKDPDTGKSSKKKVLEYEYEAAMEESYRANLIRSFKKTLEDGYFSFVILDAIHQKIKHFEDCYKSAKSLGFEVFVAEISADPHTCLKRNVHHRSLQEIEEIQSNWEPTPNFMNVLDLRQLLQDSEIQEVEMGDISDNEQECLEKIRQPAQIVEEKSKWEQEPSASQLDKLDGLKKATVKKSMDDFLSVTEDYVSRTSAPGKKRVRWADMDERQTQRRMRDVGFVVGATDWSRMMDDSHADRALNRTKFI